MIALACTSCVPDRLEPPSETPSVNQGVETRERPSPAPDTAEPITEPDAPAPAPEPSVAEPVPAPFAGRETVEVDELLAALELEVETIASLDAVRADYDAFLEDFELTDRADDGALYLDYVRVKIAFEATRAGGLWGVAWDITNEQPNSEKIWAAWRELGASPDWGAVPATVDELEALRPLPELTAIAECDELSALFAFITQRIGLSRASDVGLFWPGGNHTVAVWTIDPKADDPVRVVIPTSQIYLDGEQSLGTREFNPWKQKNIFDYRRQDAAKDLQLPALLASHFVLAVRARAGLSQAQLQRERNARETRQRGLMVDVEEQTR